jgi:hypothetical protein
MPELIDPAFDTDERTMLVQFLDYQRAVLERKALGISDVEARRPNIEPSDLTVMGLVRHMADVERNWFRRNLADEDAPPLYYGPSHPAGDEDGDLHPTDDDTMDQTLATWRAEVAHAGDVLAEFASLDELGHRDRPGGRPSVRWVLIHMIEEYARHLGHADLLRQRIDGQTGD